MKTLEELLQERILILDGAMGTMIQRYKLDEADYRGERFADWPSELKGNNDLLSLTQPTIIRDIHKAYLEAGADIVETNTFNSTTVSMADYGMEELVYEINLESAKLAREAADEFSTEDKPRFVAGVLGPTSRTGSLSPDVNDPGFRNVTFDELEETYYDATKALVEGGSDIILIETIFDTLNAKAAAFAVQNYFEDTGNKRPVMISGTITDASGRTLSGQTAEAFFNSMRHVNPISIGFNCALGAKQLRQYVEELAGTADCYVNAHPNAGLPNEFGEYDESPEDMAEELGEWAKSGLPEHHRRLLRHHPAAHQGDCRSRRQVPAAQEGRQQLRAAPVRPGTLQHRRGLAVRQRRRAHQRHRLRQVRAPDPRRRVRRGADVAREQVENGAQIIDINMDEGMLDGEAGHGHLPQPDRRRTRHLARADHDRLLQVGRSSKPA